MANLIVEMRGEAVGDEEGTVKDEDWLTEMNWARKETDIVKNKATEHER